MDFDPMVKDYDIDFHKLLFFFKVNETLILTSYSTLFIA
mgnify:CR=1 FL=1